MVEHYATYVLHLERALQDIEDILQVVSPLVTTKKPKNKNKAVLKEEKRLAKIIMVGLNSIASPPGLTRPLSRC